MKKMDEIRVTFRQRGATLEANREDVALAVKTFRLRKGLTQRQLGERWGCSRYVIMDLEGAKPISWEKAYRVFAMLSDELREEGRQ